MLHIAAGDACARNTACNITKADPTVLRIRFNVTSCVRYRYHLVTPLRIHLRADRSLLPYELPPTPCCTPRATTCRPRGRPPPPSPLTAPVAQPGVSLR